MTDNNFKIPSTWTITKLGEVVLNFKRGPFGSAIKKSCFVPEGYKVYEQKNAIYSDSELGKYYIDDEKFKELKDFEVCPNDFIVSCSGTIGKIFRIPLKAKPGIINQALLRMRLNEKVLNGKFFIILFKSKQFQDKILIQTQGSAMLNIAGVKDLKEIELLIPPLQEQHRIVSKLEELFSQLDIAVAELKKAKQQIKTFKQSVLKFAFEGKLTTENEQLKINEETGLPEGWKWVTFKDVCLQIGDVDHKMPNATKEGYPYLSTKDFTNNLKISFEKAKYISEESYNQLSKKIKPEKWDIIFPRYGTIGKNVLIDFDKVFLVSYSCAIIKPNINIIAPKYLYYYSLSPKILKEIDKYTVQTTQANIGIASINRFIVPLPIDKKEQELIIGEIETRFSEAENLEKTIDIGLIQTENLRQSILKKAFEGSLVPQDPNDEPASVLLERIKKEKLKVDNEKMPKNRGKK